MYIIVVLWFGKPLSIFHRGECYATVLRWINSEIIFWCFLGWNWFGEGWQEDFMITHCEWFNVEGEMSLRDDKLRISASYDVFDLIKVFGIENFEVFCVFNWNLYKTIQFVP